MNTCWEQMLNIDWNFWEERYRWEVNQDHLSFKGGKNLLENYQQLHKVCLQLRKSNAYLVIIVANDERRLEDQCFKLYYMFSYNTEDHFLIVEYPFSEHTLFEYLPPDHDLVWYLSQGRSYPSIRTIFKAAIPFERKIFDLMDLAAVYFPSSASPGEFSPRNLQHISLKSGFLLHDSYPPHLAPLEADKKVEDITREIEQYTPLPREHKKGKPDESILPVGPIHAGIIEAGHFSLHNAGEVVDQVEIKFGYKHRGIEKHFQTKFSLLNGWELAEKICGDSSFAHSLAYCHAVEALARIEVPAHATKLRGLFLELERLYNFIRISAALAHVVASDTVYTILAAIQEYLLQMNGVLSGHRFLRGCNRPGGMVFPPDHIEVINTQYMNTLIHKISQKRYKSLAVLWEEVHSLGELLLQSGGIRNRTFNTGTLTRKQAAELGSIGVAARSSGIAQRDFRVHHPFGIYGLEPHLQDIVTLGTATQHQQDFGKLRLSGDIFSRLQVLLNEADICARVIQNILKELEVTPDDLLIEPHIQEAIRISENLEFAVGYVQGWRGSIVHWIMKERFSKIYRIEVCDPSFINLPALSLSFEPNDPAQPDITGNIKPDFPIDNQSFAFSPAAVDG